MTAHIFYSYKVTGSYP